MNYCKNVLYSLIMKVKHLINKSLFLAAAVSFFALSSCEPEEPINNNSGDPKLDMINQTWVFHSAPINPPIDFGGGSVLKDYKTLMQACNLDNSILFNKDYTYLFKEGLSKCDPMAKDTMQGAWKFLNNQSSVMVDRKLATGLTGIAVPTNVYFRLEKLTNDSLFLAMDTIPDFPANKVVFKFIKQ